MVDMIETILQRLQANLCRAQDYDYCGYYNTAEKLEDMLEMLLHGILEYDEEKQIWEHVETCSYCASRVSMIADSFRSVENEHKMGLEEMQELVRQKERVDKLVSMIDELSKVTTLSKVLEGVGEFVNRVFSFPFPELSPAFGQSDASKVKVISPYGKVRFPVIFQWKECVDIEQYIIKTAGRKLVAGCTRLEISEEDLDLSYGKEYEWELILVRKGGEQIEGPIGYYATCTEEEADSLGRIDTEIMRMELSEESVSVVQGAVLEKRGFYVEAIEQYTKAYNLSGLKSIAVRIATCYEELGLNDFREEWKDRLYQESLR